jgi:hypothetical protein
MRALFAALPPVWALSIGVFAVAACELAEVRRLSSHSTSKPVAPDRETRPA